MMKLRKWGNPPKEVRVLVLLWDFQTRMVIKVNLDGIAGNTLPPVKVDLKFTAWKRAVFMSNLIEHKPTTEITKEEDAFCMEYLNTFCEVKAWKFARIKSEVFGKNALKWAAFEYRRQPHIDAHIQYLLRMRETSTQEIMHRVTKELKQIAFLNIKSAYDKTGELKDISMMTPEVAACIKSIKVTKVRERKEVISEITFHDKQKALDTICKLLGTTKDPADAIKDTLTSFLQTLSGQSLGPPSKHKT